jgi:iron-sulfur cluster repair protein YtfE (RIC family)
MSETMTRTVREVAQENPAAARVFEKLGIDYCCGGASLWKKPARRRT